MGASCGGAHTALHAVLLALVVQAYCLRARRRACSAVWALWGGRLAALRRHALALPA